MSKLTILLVDDHEINHVLIQKMLENEEIDLLLAFDGEQAIELLEKQKVDMVLMDIAMPMMDGYEATEHIRTQLKLESLPIIALSAKEMDSNKRVFESGMNAVVSKPIDQIQLLSVIEKYVFATSEKKHMIVLGSIELSNNYQWINMTYLKEISNGSKGFVKDMINAFLSQTPIFIQELDEALVSQDWAKMKSLLHKMKPTFVMVGISLQKDVEQMEAILKSQTELEQIQPLITKLKEVSQSSYPELNQVLVELGK